MKITVINQNGKAGKNEVELEPSIFEAKVNDALETQALRVFMYNQRGWNAKVKGRGEVRGGGRKPFAQKGTGRARQGSTRSPLQIGGGVTFGPQVKTKKLSLSKSMTKAALRSAFSRKARGNMVKVMDKLEITGEKLTKQMLGVSNAVLDGAKGKIAFIIDEKNNEISKSASNLKNVKVLLPEAINIYELANTDIVVFTESALNEISKVWKVRSKRAVVATEKAETKTKSKKASKK